MASPTPAAAVEGGSKEKPLLGSKTCQGLSLSIHSWDYPAPHTGALPRTLSRPQIPGAVPTKAHTPLWARLPASSVLVSPQELHRPPPGSLLLRAKVAINVDISDPNGDREGTQEAALRVEWLEVQPMRPSRWWVVGEKG
jgi:hypothetical protein